jgi:catechol 2,3-dioxygenase-like lactoylglutathione lyase family enzyme
MSRTVQVTFDCGDPIAQSRFWAEALHYVIQPPPGRDLAPGEDPIEAWMDFLEKAGVPEDQRDAASAVVDPDGDGPRLFFQKVPEGKTAKNRVHLDIRVAPGLEGDERMAALEAEHDRLVALGGCRVRRSEPAPPMSQGFIVMEDPEGNVFCLD